MARYPFGGSYLEGAFPAVVVPCSFALWVYPIGNLSATRMLASLSSTDGASALQLLINGTTQTVGVRSVIGATHSPQADTIAGATANNWSHVGGVFDSDTSRRAYLNGVAGAEGSGSSGVAPAITRFNIGRPVAAVAGFDGVVAFAAVWNVSLTADEMRSLAAGLSPRLVRPSALLASYRIEGTRSPEPDEWANNLPLSIFGTANIANDPRHFRPTRARVVAVPPIALPSVPTYISPANNAQGLIGSVTLQWNPSGGAASYDLYYGTTTPPPFLIGGLSDTSRSVTTAPDGAWRYWQVVARNVTGTTNGAVWAFRMLGPPATPSGPTPADNAVNVSSLSSLSWAAGVDATSWDVYFGYSPDDVPLLAAGLTTPFYGSPDIHPSALNYWLVVAHNAVGYTVGPVWKFRASAESAKAQLRFEAQLGEGFRSRLIRTGQNAGTWPLSEVSGRQARDVGGMNYHGAWVGSFEWGFGFDVPEGALGAYFNGNGYVQVPNVVNPSGPTLSLDGGDMDQSILIRGYNPADSTVRALMAKHDGPRSTFANGWYLSIQNGMIVWQLKAGGAVVFSFARGPITNGEHLITCTFLAGSRAAWISIDGVPQGATVTTAALVGVLTTAPLRIGHFNDGVAGDGAGFVGFLAYASQGRQGSVTLAQELQAQRVWTDLTPHVRTTFPLEMRIGIPGTGPADNVATSGSLQWALDNGTRVPVGYYTPGHPAQRPGWGLGDPVRISFLLSGVRYYAFHGRVIDAAPAAGQRGSRHVDCLATDWIDIAASTPLSATAVALGANSQYVVKAVLDQTQGRSPAGVELHAGSGVFPFAIESGESETDTMLTELSRIVTSEAGFLYLRGDTQRGMTLVYEGHADRVVAPVKATFDNTMQGLEVGFSVASIVNIVRLTYTPRTVDSSVVVLYTLPIDQVSHYERILEGETRVFEGGYVDPTNAAERVGATELVPLVAGVDIGFNESANGDSTDLNQYLKIVQTLGGNSFRLELTNKNPFGALGYLYLTPQMGFRIRGKGIYNQKPVMIERRDGASVREHGPRVLEIQLPYESDPIVATQLAEFYLEVYGGTQPIPSSLTIAANRSAALLRVALNLQPGDKIALGEPVTGLTPLASRFVIQEKRLTYTEPGILTVAFSLAPAPASLLLRREVGPQSPS